MSKISKTIPIPTRKAHVSRFNSLELEKLEVGDSIKLKDITGYSSQGYMSSYNIVSRAVDRIIARRGICGSFRIAVYNNKNKKELRVWRTK